MYDIGDILPVSSVPEGTTLLCHGPPMVGKRSLVTSLLAQGIEAGDGTVVISTDSSAVNLRQEFEAAVGRPPGRQLGIVDCTGEAGQRSGEPLDRTVSSPADLTGIGVGVSEILEHHHTEGDFDRHRLGLLSLTSAFLYAESDRVLKFVHVLTQRIQQIGGFGLLLAETKSIDDNDFGHLGTLVDGTVTLAEEDGQTVCRVRGLDDAPSDWHRVDFEEEVTNRGAIGSKAADVTDTERGGDAGAGGAGTAEEWFRDPEGTPTLSEIIDAVERDRPTLTVYNFEGEPTRLERLRVHCETLNVSFRERTLQEPEPRNLAVLHRGPDVIEGLNVETLFGALELDDASLPEFENPDVLSDLSRDTFGARGANRQFLIDMSHVIEIGAWREGRGTLHAGFQDLARLWDDDETRRIYRRLAESGIDVHVYGTGDGAGESWPGLTEHAVEDAEITDSWFVVYDGGGDADETATLLVEERVPDTYTGFWSFRPEVADVTIGHLERTYG